MERSSIDVTLFLKRYSSGDQNALAELIPQIYDELRRLASCYLQRERVDHTLQTTALVHEAYFRLVDQKKVEWTNRNHFFGVAAQMMRRILVDHARKRHAFKRGSSWTRGKQNCRPTILCRTLAGRDGRSDGSVNCQGET